MYAIDIVGLFDRNIEIGKNPEGIGHTTKLKRNFFIYSIAFTWLRAHVEYILNQLTIWHGKNVRKMIVAWKWFGIEVNKSSVNINAFDVSLCTWNVLFLNRNVILSLDADNGGYHVNYATDTFCDLLENILIDIWTCITHRQPNRQKLAIKNIYSFAMIVSAIVLAIYIVVVGIFIVSSLCVLFWFNLLISYRCIAFIGYSWWASTGNFDTRTS